VEFIVDKEVPSDKLINAHMECARFMVIVVIENLNKRE
jgi:hypothetical protein